MKSSLLGVISDTHGLLRPEAVAALRSCSRIIHAGDVGSAKVLGELRSIAPTVAVRGNVDRGEWADALPTEETFLVGGVNIHVLHDLHALPPTPTAGVRVVVSGHSHQPRIEEKGGVLYINPGAAGPRRFRLPVTLAHLEIGPGRKLDARLIDLLVAASSAAI